MDPKGQNPDPNPGRDPNRNHVQWPDPKDLHQNPENPDLDPVQDQKDLGRNNRKDLEDLADPIVKTEILKNVGERRRKGNEKLKIEIQWKWNQISIWTNGNLKKVCKIYQIIFFTNLLSTYVNCTYKSYFILKCLKFMEDMVSPLETFQSSTIKLIAQV